MTPNRHHLLPSEDGTQRGRRPSTTADTQVLTAHGTRIAVERDREVLADTAAESVDVHIGDPEMVG